MLQQDADLIGECPKVLGVGWVGRLSHSNIWCWYLGIAIKIAVQGFKACFHALIFLTHAEFGGFYSWL